MSTKAEPVTNSRSRTWIAYGLMLALTAAGFSWIQARGTGLVAPAPAAFGTGTPAGGGAASGTLLHILLALAVILVLAMVQALVR